MSQISKISINGTEYNLSEKLSSYYTSYSEPAFPSAGDSVETAISKLHTDVELISRLGYLSEDYTAYEAILYEGPQPDDSIELAISKLHKVILDNEEVVSASLIDLNEKIETVADNSSNAGNAYLSEDYTAYAASLGAEPQPNDSIELAISKLHKVILDDEYSIASSLIDLNSKSFNILRLDYENNSYVLYDEKSNEISLNENSFYTYVNNHSIIKFWNNDKYLYFYPFEEDKFISIDNQTIYWIEFTYQQGNYIIQTGQQPIESQFINSTAYNISQSDITNWNNKLDSFTETDPTVASYIKSIKQTDILNWNSKTDNAGTITGITMNGVSKGTSGVVDLGTVITYHQDISGKQDVITDLQTIRNNAYLGSTALQSFNETDPIFTASVAHDITLSDISNWNSKTNNTGTITEIRMNNASKGTSGVVDLGTVITNVDDKVDKVTGMGLSSNDYTTAEKNKLAGINIGDLSNLTTAELNSIFS